MPDLKEAADSVAPIKAAAGEAVGVAAGTDSKKAKKAARCARTSPCQPLGPCVTRSVSNAGLWRVACADGVQGGREARAPGGRTEGSARAGRLSERLRVKAAAPGASPVEPARA